MILAGKKLVATLAGVFLVAGAAGAAGGYVVAEQENRRSPEQVSVTVTPRATPTPSVNPRFTPPPGAQNVESDRDQILRVSRAYDAAIQRPAGAKPSDQFGEPKIKGSFATVAVGGSGGGYRIILKKANGVWVVISSGQNDDPEAVARFGIPGDL